MLSQNKKPYTVATLFFFALFLLSFFFFFFTRTAFHSHPSIHSDLYLQLQPPPPPQLGGDTDHVTDAQSDPHTVTENVANDASQTATESVADDASQTVTENVANDASQTVTENVADDAPQTVTENVADDATQTVTENVADDATQIVTENVADDAPETVTENVADDASKTVTENVTDDATQTVTENVADDAPETVTENVAEDAPKTVTENDGDGASQTVTENLKECDLFTGTWVKDENYPIYEAGSCPYVDEAYDCKVNGRTDTLYTKWQWKPDACDLPRFNATDFLVRLKGKSLMLVGDSMNRNQFESILCILREGLQNKSCMYEIHGHKITKGRGYFVFKFEDYNCTVQFVRSHFLVKEGVRLNGQGSSNPTLSIDRIDKTSSRWKRADILVFNTGHWWTHGKTARGVNYYKEGDYLYPKFDAVEAYRKAIKTWAKWIDDNLNPQKQIVYYRGYSNAHFRGGDWDSGGSCNGETEPVLNGSILNNYPLKMKIVEEVIQGMKFPVKLLNITKLTNFRKDGHPSVYGKNTMGGKKISTRKQDCSHWCLPGVPDAWNELIYATLVYQQTNSRN